MKLTRGLCGVVVVVGLGVVASANANASADPLALQCDPGTVSETIAKKQPVTQKECYGQVHGKLAITTDVKITAHLSYGKDGAMMSVSTKPSTGTSAAHALDICVAGQLRGWVLPCGPNQVDVAFDFPHD